MRRKYVDKPRTLRDEGERNRRIAMLSKPHIAPLTEYVETLNKKLSRVDKAPYFDPLDGGVNAKVLFLFEKPGRMADGSGFISRNNDDPTAENTFRIMQQAAIDRKITCTWNVVPIWNGTVNLESGEVRQNIDKHLKSLLALFKKLQVIVLVGKQAHKAHSLIRKYSPAIVIHSFHPSPRWRAINPQDWDTIKYSWIDARRCLGLPANCEGERR